MPAYLANLKKCLIQRSTNKKGNDKKMSYQSEDGDKNYCRRKNSAYYTFYVEYQIILSFTRQDLNTYKSEKFSSFLSWNWDECF